MYTPAHRNKWWCIACEFIVTLHGPLIAIGRGGTTGMFGFGFAIVFMCSGQWGLPLNKATRYILAVTFLVCLFTNYGMGLSRLNKDEMVSLKDVNEIIRIPAFYYMCMGFYILFYLSVRWIHNIQNRKLKCCLGITACIIATIFGFLPFIAIVGLN